MAVLRGGVVVLNVSSDFMLVLAAIFSSGWRIVTSFQIPGTNINVAEFAFACFMIVFVIKVVPAFLGFSSIFENFGLGSSDTGGHPQNGTKWSDKADRGNDHGVGRW